LVVGRKYKLLLDNPTASKLYFTPRDGDRILLKKFDPTG